MGQVRAKMALSCPSWRQDGPKMPILDFKMTNLRPFSEVSCLLFGILGAKGQIAKNLEKLFVGFQGFWGSWGCSWRPCWLILARRWAMLGQLGAILEQLGDKMRSKSAKMSQDRAGDVQGPPHEARQQRNTRWAWECRRGGKVGPPPSSTDTPGGGI